MATTGSNADANAAAAIPLVGNKPLLFNGTTSDRQRGLEEVTLLASAARTTTQVSADLLNYNGMSALVVALDVTAVTASGTLTVLIERKDTASGKYVTLLQGATVSTPSTNIYKVGPYIPAVANSIAQDYLGRIFRITVTANAISMTYSVGYTLIRD